MLINGMPRETVDKSSYTIALPLGDPPVVGGAGIEPAYIVPCEVTLIFTPGIYSVLKLGSLVKLFEKVTRCSSN